MFFFFLPEESLKAIFFYHCASLIYAGLTAKHLKEVE